MLLFRFASTSDCPKICKFTTWYLLVIRICTHEKTFNYYWYENRNWLKFGQVFSWVFIRFYPKNLVIFWVLSRCLNPVIMQSNATQKVYPLNYGVTTILLNTRVSPSVKLTINSFPHGFFPDNSPTFDQFPDISLTAVNFSDISRFSGQVVNWSSYK